MTIDTPTWVRDAVFYQIFPDRFCRSGRIRVDAELESWDSPPTANGFKGGDLYGVVEKLDYLQALGATAIYFCPIFASAANHRYHTYDYYQVDPLLGGNEALRCLLDAAHERDMKVVLDGVFNHSSRGFWPFHHVLENGAASPYRDWFHLDPARLSGKEPFHPYPSGKTAQQLAIGGGSLESIGYSAWWNLPALPKFNTACPAVRRYLLEVAEHWADFGIDGWRLDVPDEIDDDEFWREFRWRVRKINPELYIVGEVWGEARRWLTGDMWDAVTNYPLTIACLGFFPGDHIDLEEIRRVSSFSTVRRWTGSEFADRVVRAEGMYAPEIARSQLNMLDSHDTPRFLTCSGGDRESLKMAWLFLCTVTGAPCIYYGDEVGLEGGHDPDCRRGMPWSPSARDDEMRSWFTQCIRTRQQFPQLRDGPLRVLEASADTVSFMHGDNPESLVSAFNVGDAPVELRYDRPSTTGSLLISNSPATRVRTDDGQCRLALPARAAALIG